MTDYFERLEGELRGAVQRGVGTAATVTAPGNRAPGGWVAIALGAVATVAVVVAAAALGIGRDGGSQGAIPTGAHGLVARFEILRRPQRAADRAYPAWLLVPLPGRRYRDFQLSVVPGLTRVVNVARGVRVVMFVAKSAGRPKARNRSLRTGYAVFGVAFAVPDRAAPRATIPGVEGGSNAINGVRIGIVPDGVARVRWDFATEVSPATGIATTPRSVTAVVHDNVASAIDARRALLAATTEYDASGKVLATQDLGFAGRLVTVTTSSTPSPETALSRRAERDPSTPSLVRVFPTVGRSDENSFNVYFRVLAQGAEYGASVTGGPHAGCAPNYLDDRLGSGSRGQMFVFPLQAPRWCRGKYRVSVYVVSKDGRRYPPFGSATFRVR